jgi:hypothetical protein
MKGLPPRDSPAQAQRRAKGDRYEAEKFHDFLFSVQFPPRPRANSGGRERFFQRFDQINRGFYFYDDPLPARFMKKGRFSSRNLVYKKALGLPNFQITLSIIVGGLLTILKVQSGLFV